MTRRTSTRAKEGHTTIGNHDLQILLLHDFRYSLGRMTSAPHNCVQKLLRWWDVLSPCFQAQIQQDIIDAAHTTERLYALSEWYKILELSVKDDDL